MRLIAYCKCVATCELRTLGTFEVAVSRVKTFFAISRKGGQVGCKELEITLKNCANHDLLSETFQPVPGRLSRTRDGCSRSGDGRISDVT